MVVPSNNSPCGNCEALPNIPHLRMTSCFRSTWTWKASLVVLVVKIISRSAELLAGTSPTTIRMSPLLEQKSGPGIQLQTTHPQSQRRPLLLVESPFSVIVKTDGSFAALAWELHAERQLGVVDGELGEERQAVVLVREVRQVQVAMYWQEVATQGSNWSVSGTQDLFHPHTEVSSSYLSP